MHTMTPNDFGKITIEDCQKISVSDYLKKFRDEFKQAVLSSVADVVGEDISLSTSRTHFGGKRYWFTCPHCNKRIGTLLIHPISQKVGCRKCLGVNYKKRKFSGMLESNLF